ncbi:hypothetical protein OSB04_018476 [Centaurea solstitialis]|uniref:Uncharacterized protein n=1 Tax=Centaurea solstitialis TaxID=347529 RepID=A0AA38TI60_9ASTR|nr:hypothetical protein OSB04_018476 [Centaurea solstitialis]
MEIALLSTYKHENLVSFVGFCDQDDEKILVYKHESNGSLDKLLHSKDLNWIQRLRICLDAACGLKYLHDDVGSQHRVIHRDIKSSNILLDENWRAKISDFGLSKIGPANMPFTVLISKPCGTIGYVDPEYVKTGVLSQRSDVFSFGVVLFEVLCGRLAHGVQYQHESQLLYKLVKNHYEKGKLEVIIDDNLQKQINSSSMSSFSTIAYKCLMKRREDRPTMRQVVEQLQKALNYQLAAVSGWHGAALQQGPSTSMDYMTQYSGSASSSPAGSTRVTAPPSWTYDVFVSFGEPDLDGTFMDHLYLALRQNGIYCYMDDKTLDVDESTITLLHFKAIRESQIVLIVFSKNYASSSRCLRELAYVRRKGKLVIPIYLNVQPKEVREQSGEFGEAFSIHKSNINKVESWINALADATSITGFMTSADNRRIVIKSIVDTISPRLIRSKLISNSKTCGIIGGMTRMQDLEAQLKVGSGGVRMVGICGTWGTGKSTLASAIYQKLHHEFEGCCFVENFRAESRMHGLKTLLEKILSDVLKPRKVVLESIEEGRSMMKTIFSHTCVLIILDDVDHLDHLKMLVGSDNWFGVGSRIIITTRNKNLVNAHKINMVVYDMKPLNEKEALELFSWHAFGANRPVEGYEKLSVDMVSKFGGNPSALISLGSFLRGTYMSKWIRTSARLKDTPDHETAELFKTVQFGVVDFSIIRLWSQPLFKDPEQLYSIEMILMDEEKSKVTNNLGYAQRNRWVERAVPVEHGRFCGYRCATLELDGLKENRLVEAVPFINNRNPGSRCCHGCDRRAPQQRSRLATIFLMAGHSRPSKFTQWMAVSAISSTATASFSSGGPTRLSRIFLNSPDLISGTEKSTRLISAPP